MLLCSTSTSSLSNLLIFHVYGWKSFVFWLDLDAIRWYVLLCCLKILLLQTSQAPSLMLRSIRVRKVLAQATIFLSSASYLSGFTQDEFLLCTGYQFHALNNYRDVKKCAIFSNFISKVNGVGKASLYERQQNLSDVNENMIRGQS